MKIDDDNFEDLDDLEDFDDFDETEHKSRSSDNKSLPAGLLLAGGVIVFCAAVFFIGFFIGKRDMNEPEDPGSALTVEDLAPAPEVVDTQDDEITALEGDTEMGDAAGDATAEPDATEAGLENDPQAAAAMETGEAVDISQLVNASSVGENSSVTYGIDVSKFQGTIDWALVAGSGVDFAMVRVGYRDSSTGEIKADSNARYNMQEAEKNGIKIGAYFFSTAVSTEEAVAEADWVADYISQYPITYPVGYNCEGFDNASSRQFGLSNDDRSRIAAAFLDQIYSHGYTPIFYASMGELSGDAKWNTSELQQKYKIWMAWYNQDTSDIAQGPSYDGQCVMWQYTNNGTVAGIGKSVDVDVAYFGYDGTETAKDTTSERETAEADVEALMKFNPVDETVTAKNSTNLRDKPSQGQDSTVKVTLSNGQTAQRTGISDSGWSRVVYEGNTYYAVSSYLTTDLNAPKQEDAPVQEESTTGFKTKFTDCNEIVTAKELVNLRNKPSVTDEDSVVVATLHNGETAVRTGVNAEFGWSRVEYNGQTLYCVSSYLTFAE
jgi:GH25 family lysozyme M1 (1,4-beta-N-acetylmuramidase)